MGKGLKGKNLVKEIFDPLGLVLKQQQKNKRPPTAGELFDQQQRTLENYMLSYDELVRLGRIDVPAGTPGYDPSGTGGGFLGGSRPGTAGGLDPSSGYYGLSGNESRLSRGIGAYEDSLAAGDPAFAAYRDYIQGQAENIGSGGIPDDFRRTLTEELRSSQAARGTLEGGTPGLEEAIRLMGGQEAIRSSRLNDVTNYLSGVTSGALASLLPNAGQYLNIASNQSGLQTQLTMQQRGIQANSNSDLLGAVGFIGGSYLGGPGGGAAGREVLGGSGSSNWMSLKY